MQTPDETYGNFSGSQMWNPNTTISEDCLYLNVYAPRKEFDEVCDQFNFFAVIIITLLRKILRFSQYFNNYFRKFCNIIILKMKKLPVLIWIYGGGYMSGSASLDVYNPEELVRRGNIIFVSFNYRVGPNGFLYLNSSDAPGNVGMLDQVILQLRLCIKINNIITIPQ